MGSSIADKDIFDIYFDLDDNQFLPRVDINNKHANLKLSTLFNVAEYHRELERLHDDHKKLAQNVWSQFANYEIPLVTITKRDKSEVGIIFERINHSGTNLTTIDLMIAWTWSENFNLREEFNGLLEILDRKGFGETPDKIILQCLSGMIQQTTKTSDIIEMDPTKIRDNIFKLEDTLEKTVDFLSTELNIRTRDFLPHSHQIVPLAFFFANVNTLTTEQITILKQWFWKTSFSKRYSGSTDMKMNEDIAFFQKVLRGKFSDINKYSYSVDSNDLINQTFSKSNPFTRAFLLLLAQKQPLNLVNGSKIDLGQALSQYNAKEYHHIFPRSFLKAKGVEASRINSMCNFCFLPADSNKIIADKAPSDYIGSLRDKQYAPVLGSNLMPLKKEIYLNNKYDEFLQQRAEDIIRFLDNLAVS